MSPREVRKKYSPSLAAVVDLSQPLPIVLCVGYSSEWWICLSHNKLASGFMLTIAISRPLSSPQQEVDHSEPQQVVILHWLQPIADLSWSSKANLSAAANLLVNQTITN